MLSRRNFFSKLGAACIAAPVVAVASVASSDEASKGENFIHLVEAAADLNDDQFKSLVEQVDLALNTPDFAIITDFPVHWTKILHPNLSKDEALVRLLEE